MATTWHTSVSVKAIDQNEAQLEAKRKEINSLIVGRAITGMGAFV